MFSRRHGHGRDMGRDKMAHVWGGVERREVGGMAAGGFNLVGLSLDPSDDHRCSIHAIESFSPVSTLRANLRIYNIQDPLRWEMNRDGRNEWWKCWLVDVL